SEYTARTSMGDFVAFRTTGRRFPHTNAVSGNSNRSIVTERRIPLPDDLDAARRRVARSGAALGSGPGTSIHTPRDDAASLTSRHFAANDSSGTGTGSHGSGRPGAESSRNRGTM